MMIVNNPIGLIGDVLGTFPVLQQLNKDNPDLKVIPHPEVKWVYDLVPDLELCEPQEFDNELNLSGAFTVSHQHGVYMSQAHYPFMGYPIPNLPCKAELSLKQVDVNIYDYIIAPFGRSAPNEQKWPVENWLKLIELMPDKQFAIFGTSKHDLEFPDYLPNVTNIFDRDIHEICNLMIYANHGVISIVTGISHLCYHLGVKNYLLTNQIGMTWGMNPEAVIISNHIPSLTPIQLHDILSTERE